ncbi:MAG: GAF domain-containing protein [Syntrophales bacterium]|nr:GAF domain-containing protein [Syntrophales bacterium]
MEEKIDILLLEDSASDAELEQFELQEAGLDFTMKCVMTEKEYVQAITESCPDLILSDFDLPQYNGTLALAEARRRCPDVPFILVTGAVGEDRAIEILTHGAKDYVLKSRLHRLAPAVRRALAEAREQKARRRAESELRQAHRNLESQVAQRTAELQKEIMHRKQIEESLLKYNERLELLSYTASRLLTNDRPQQIIEELCLKVMEFLDCQAFFNFLVDEQSGRLHLNACAGIPTEIVREIEWLDFGVAVCGCAARDGSRIIAENIPETLDVRTELVKSFGITAYACHPLMDRNHVIGTLSFGTRTQTAFTADDLAMMKLVADQVAIALSRVRAMEALQESEERYRYLIESFPYGIIVHHEGRFLYANSSALRMLGAESLTQLQTRTALELIHPDYHGAAKANKPKEDADGNIPSHELWGMRMDGQVIPLEAVGNTISYRGEPAIQIIFRDVTRRLHRTNELNRLNKTLTALSKSHRAFMNAASETEFMEGVCRIVVEYCGHAMVWIGLAEEDEGKTVRPVAHAGFEDGYLETLRITWSDAERGRGPTGTAIRTGKPSICRNMLTDPDFEPWRKEAIKRGYASSIVLPLISGDKTFGALTIYSREPDPFTNDEVKLLSELATDLSCGIMSIKFRNA